MKLINLICSAVVEVLRSAVTPHRDTEPKCEDLFIFTHQKGSVPPVMVQNILLTHQKISLFWQTPSPGLHGAVDKIRHAGFQMTHGTVDTFSTTQCKHIPLLWYNTFILLIYCSIWVHLCTSASAKYSCLSDK